MEKPSSIEFRSEDVSRGQVDITMYPIKGKHKARDIQRAKSEIKKKFKVRYVQIHWRMNDDVNFEPSHKVPESVIIGRLKEQIGQQESYILELEEKLHEKDEYKPTAEQIKEIKKEQIYKEQKEQISKLSRKVGKCAKDQRDLIHRLVQADLQVPKSITLLNDDDSYNS